MIVTYVHSSHPQDEYRVRLRCRNFVDAINRVGWHSANLLDLDAFAHNTPEAGKICEASDLIVVHRYLYGPVLEAVTRWKARDKKVIVDFDQAFDCLTPDMPGYSFWLEGKPFDDCAQTEARASIDPPPLEQFKWGLGLIDAAIVSTTQLAVDWSSHANVHEVPDYLNTDQYPAYKQAHENEVWIGLARGIRPASLRESGAWTAVENVCRKRPQARLVLCGLEGQRSYLDIDPSQIKVCDPEGPDGWADALLGLDLGLVPAQGKYDLRLGPISLLEFMISKTPWIASDQASFQGLARFGNLVPNSAADWELALLTAVDNIVSLQKYASGEPFLYALSQDVNENIDKVLKLFTRILNRA